MSLVQDHRIGAIEELTRRSLEIPGGWIKNSEIKVWTHELQNAVRFEDHIFRALDALTKRWRRFRKTSLLSANPKDPLGACLQKSRSVGIAIAVTFLGDCPRMIPGRTVASRAVG